MAKLNLSTLVAQLGAYFRQKDPRIITRMYQEPDSAGFTTLRTGIKDELVSTSAKIGELLQAFQCGWTPKGTVVMDPIINKTFPVKWEVEIDCLEELERTYEAYLYQEGKTVREQPFVNWLIENVIIPQVIEDIALNEASATYAAPVSGTPGAAASSFDGYLTVVQDLITAGALTPIAIGAINPTNIHSQSEAFVKAIPARYRNKGGQMLMSDTNACHLFEDYRNTFPFSYATDKPFMVKLSNTNIMARGVVGMEGSDRFIFTPKSNFIKMIDVVDVSDAGDNRQFLQVDTDKRKICLWVEGKIGFGFLNVEELFVSDNA